MMRRFMNVMMLMAVFALVPGVALAADGPDATRIFAVVFSVAFAAFGGTLSQGRAAAAALEGICRNPGAAEKVSTPLILSLAFIESLVIFVIITIFLIP